jgi:hypothetical protein
MSMHEKLHLYYPQAGRCFMCHNKFIPENKYQFNCSQHCRERFREYTRMTIEILYHNTFPNNKSYLLFTMNYILEAAEWNIYMENNRPLAS